MSPAGADPEPGPAEWFRPSVLLLVAANLFTLFGVVFRGWPVFPIMLIFWMENAVIGAINILKILLASPGTPGSGCARAILVPFFWVHYGGFLSAHGFFVFMVFSGFLSDRERYQDVGAIWQSLRGLGIGWAVLALVVSHAYSFVQNYVRGGEFRRADPRALMLQPYGRVLILHAAVLVGGIFTVFLGSPAPAVAVLVVLKTLLDARAHLRERRKFAPAAGPTSAAPRGSSS